MTNSSESSPLLPTQDAIAEGAPNKGFRFLNRATLFVCAVAGTYLLLAFVATSGNVKEDSSQLALKPEIIDQLNNAGLSWTAHIPEGFEKAAHKDLKRIAGGRLSTRPRSKDWKMSEYASKDHKQPAVGAVPSSTPA